MRHFVLMKIQILLLATLTACFYKPDAINTIEYSDVEIGDIKNSITVVASTFEKVKRMQGIPERDLGFVVVADSIYYRHCVDPEGRFYKSESCDIELFLTQAENQHLNNAIQYLKERNVIGSFFCLPLEAHVMILGTKYYDFEDGRYLFYSNDSDSLLLKSPYDALDSKHDLLLLKDRR